MILDEITTSILNKELSLAQELEIRKIIDNPKNSTIKSIIINFEVNQYFTINDLSSILLKILAYFPQDIYYKISNKVNKTFPKTLSSLNIQFTDDNADNDNNGRNIRLMNL